MNWLRNRVVLSLAALVALATLWFVLRTLGIVGAIAPRDAIKEAKTALEGPATRVTVMTSVEGPRGISDLPARFQAEGVILGSGANGSFIYDLSSIPNGGGILGQLQEFEVRLFEDSMYLDVLPGAKSWLRVGEEDLDRALHTDLHLLRQVLIASPAFILSFVSDEGELARLETERPTYTSRAALSDLERDARGFAQDVLESLAALGADEIFSGVVLDDDLDPERFFFELRYPVVESSPDDIIVKVDVSIEEIGVGAGVSVPDSDESRGFSELLQE